MCRLWSAFRGSPPVNQAKEGHTRRSHARHEDSQARRAPVGAVHGYWALRARGGTSARHKATPRAPERLVRGSAQLRRQSSVWVGLILATTALGGAKLAGQDVSGQKVAGQKLAGQNLAGQNLAGQKLAGQKLAGQNPAGQKLAGQKLAGQNPAGQKLAGQNLAGQNLAGQVMSDNQVGRHRQPSWPVAPTGGRA